MFGLKFPSLLKFDDGRDDIVIKHNLKTLYHVDNAPNDTSMREHLDEVDPKKLRSTYKSIFSSVQRGNELNEFKFLNDHYLLAGDGTGFFSSSETHCNNCCVKEYGKCSVKFTYKISDDFKKNTYTFFKSKGTWELCFVNSKLEKTQIKISDIDGLENILKSEEKLSKDERKLITEIMADHYKKEYPDDHKSYYHNMYCAAIVNPYMKIVLPFPPEPIMKEDGSLKNDCERNAAKRLYADIRREHPHLKLIIVEDSIASNVPHLTDLKNLDMRYIVGVKEGDHKFLFDLIKKSECTEHTTTTEEGTLHFFRYLNQAQLNKSHPDFKVNFLEYFETDKNNKKQHFSFVSDIEITNENVFEIMKGGRSNWKIENNTFNTLKNQNYHFSHNFGHGYKNLCSVFGTILMLAFFIDQVEELACHLWKKARAKFRSRTSLWDKIRGMFNEHFIKCWDDLFNAIAYGTGSYASVLAPNSS